MAWRSVVLLALVLGATVATGSGDINSCQACRSTVSFARRFNSSHHRQEYTELFRGFCEQYYPPSTDFQQGPCSVFVQGLFYVMDNTDPITHCDNIGLCGPAQPSDDIYQYLQSSNVAETTKPPPPPDQIICDYCLDLFDRIKRVLTDPVQVDKVKAKADELCEYLKVVDEDKKCKEYTNQYIEYVQHLIKQVDSRKYCTDIRMCRPRPPDNASPDLKQLPTLADFNNFGIETSVSIGEKPSNSGLSQFTKGPECTLCKTVVKEMFHFLRENKTEENIINGLNRVCHLVYPTQPKLEQCQSMVKAYTRELVQLLVDETDPEVICMLLEQCTYTNISEPRQITQDVTPAPATTTNDLAHLITALDSSIGFKSLRSCVECKIFIKYLKDKLDNPKSQDEIKHWLLDNLCKELPEKNLVTSCSEMVESYSATFFKAISGDLNPQTACVELGVCSPKSIVQVLKIGDPLTSSITLNPVVPSGIRRAVVPKERRCSRCIDVVSYLDDYLSKHPMSDETSWNKICNDTANSSINNHCLSIMTRHGSDIVQMIPTMESPRHLCQQIALC